MQNLQNAIDFILSDDYLKEVMDTLKWCSHGSDVFDYFEYEGLEYEFANSRERKIIIKDYIKKRTKEIINEFKEESPEFLYRAIYCNKVESHFDFYGYYWSAREDTCPYIEIQNENEFLLIISFHDSLIDWIETLKSRMDFLYGKKEKEYFLTKEKVSLVDIKQI